MAQGPARPFSYEQPLEQPPPVHTPPPHQPSPGALEQAARLRAAAATHQQRAPAPTAAPPREEFSYIETPIEDNTQDFEDAPPHVQQAIMDARQARSTPSTHITTPQPQQTQYGYPEHSYQHQPYTEQRLEEQIYIQSQIPQQSHTQLDQTQHYSTTYHEHATQPQPTTTTTTYPSDQQYPAHTAFTAQTQALTPTKPLPQPPLTPGPVPMKSEEDFKAAHPEHHPYQNNPKLHPYTPDSFPAPPSTYQNTQKTPFSPDTLHNPPLDISSHQPGQQAHPNMTSRSSKSSAWSSSLCSCGPDVTTCMTGIFCPCMLYARTNYRLAQKSRKQDPTDMLGHSEGCSGHCALFALACGFQGILTTILGARVRHAYNIEGEGTIGEFCKSCCCCCCALVQNEREVKTREREKQRWAGPSVGGAGAYGRRDDMAYRPIQ